MDYIISISDMRKLWHREMKKNVYYYLVSKWMVVDPNNSKKSMHT